MDRPPTFPCELPQAQVQGSPVGSMVVCSRPSPSVELGVVPLTAVRCGAAIIATGPRPMYSRTSSPGLKEVVLGSLQSMVVEAKTAPGALLHGTIHPPLHIKIRSPLYDMIGNVGSFWLVE